jgi:hypothetical protein
VDIEVVEAMAVEEETAEEVALEVMIGEDDDGREDEVAIALALLLEEAEATPAPVPSLGPL